MPAVVEACVQEKLADPSFKPREGQTKEEAAWAICNWLHSEGKLGRSSMAWKVGAARNLDIVHFSGWDGQKAKDQIFSWAGWPDDPKPSKARKGFLLFNDDDTALKGNYKLPFCYVKDGKLVAADSGLAAARTRVGQTSAPDDVLDDAQGVLDHYKDRQEKEKESKSLPPKSRSFCVILPITRTKPPDWLPDDGLWLHIEASGPEPDTHKTRMSEQCLQRMVEYAEEGIDGAPLPFLDGHYDDLLAAMLGEVHAPYLTTERHFAFFAKLDERNPQALRLYNDVETGKRHGASIAGWAHDWEEEIWTDDEGKEHTSLIFHDIQLGEISRTSWPSWQPSFIELVAKRLSTEPLDNSVSRQVRAIRDSVVFCRPDGMCVQLVRDDGRVNLARVYATTLALTRRWSPELANSEPNVLLGGLLTSGMVDTEIVLECARSASGFITDMPLDDQVKLGNQVVGIFRSHLLREPPVMVLSAYGRAVDRLETRREFGELLVRSMAHPEERNMGKKAETTEQETVEEEVVAEVEEASENDQETVEAEVEMTSPERRGILSDTVNARMLGQQFSEATWAMQDLVWDSLLDTDEAMDDRLTRAEAVIAEFADMATGLVRQMASSGYIPRSADDFRQLSAQRVELAEARLSVSRIEALRSAFAELFLQGSDLMELLERADFEPAGAAEGGEEEVEENVQEVAASLLDKRLAQMAEERRAAADRVFASLNRGSGRAAPPAGVTASGGVGAQTGDSTPAVQQSNIETVKAQFVESTFRDKQTRRVGGRRAQ